MKRLLLTLLCIMSIKGMELEVSSLESVKVISHRNKIYVKNDSASYHVEPHRMNKELRDLIAHKALKKFKESKAGYVRVTKDSENKYNLAA